jgi:parallel beta-helix repeat protein
MDDSLEVWNLELLSYVSFPGEEEFMRFLRRLPARQPVSTRSRPVLSGLEERAVPATFTVDDSFTPNPAERRYNTIQAAVTAADLTPEEDVIRVGPGTYREAVVVPATEPGLTILGAFSGQDAAQRSRDIPRPSRDSIVDPPAGASAFTLNADRVVVDGFTVRGATGKAGITTSKSASGDRIQFNEIRDNTFGLYLNTLNTTAALETIVQGNAFVDNNEPGSSSGNGIYSDQGVRNATIMDNFFTRQESASLIFVGGATPAAAQSNVRIRENQMVNDAAVILANVTDSIVSNNTSFRSNGSGIFLAGGCKTIDISGNTLIGGAFTGINVRFRPGDFPVTTNNTSITIRENDVRGFGDSGIRLRDGTSGNSVLGNHVSYNGWNHDRTSGDGISLEDADKNFVRDNTSDHNRRDGLRVDADSSGNTITGNRLTRNGGHDAHDNSTGTGTAGTANTWTGNVGRTQNRRGLLDGHAKGVAPDNGEDDNYGGFAFGFGFGHGFGRDR